MTEEEKEYAKTVERSLSSIEDCCAEMVGSLDKLRASVHTLVGKSVVLEEIATNLSVVANLAKTMSEVAPKLGHLMDRVDRLEEQR